MTAGAPLDRPEVKTSPDSEKFGYIDAVRGWAIFLVISCHVGGRFAEMPYPVKKLTNFGWHGVQMFFLASAVTLTMSWGRQKITGRAAVKNFFIRRFLRIAPMYYLGALIYFLAEPPASGFDLAQMLRSFLFINAWRPDWIPTTPGWMVVPGGWSIGVEFTFYALFPIIVCLVTSLRRAIVFLIFALIVAIGANNMAEVWLAQYDVTAVQNFIYFWFPNQMPVFALGILLYHLISIQSLRIDTDAKAYGIIGIAGIACILAAELPNGASYSRSLSAVPPIYIASLAFAVFILALAKGPKTFFTNSWIRRLGVLSFSSYVMHFLFVAIIPDWSGGVVDVAATGYRAIAMYGVLWILVMPATIAASALCHKFIEQPGIDLAHRLTSSIRKKPDAPAATTATAH